MCNCALDAKRVSEMVEKKQPKAPKGSAGSQWVFCDYKAGEPH